MTKEVQIGGQIVKLRATARLPIAYRALHNRDLLRDMDAWREKLKDRIEQMEVSDNTQGESVEVSEAPVQADEQTPQDSTDTSRDASEILYEMDLDLVARLAHAMAKSADPSIPKDMEEWLDALESPSALYILTGEVLTLYNNGFETTAQAKKNIPPQLAK